VYVYGGLGCEPNLKLAAFDIETKTWSFPTQENFAPCNFRILFRPRIHSHRWAQLWLLS
jgi:hypothetical protein